MLAWMTELFAKFSEGLMSVLPKSPFIEFTHGGASLGQGLSWLNWFIDIPGLLQVFAAWLSAYAIYLLYRIVLRWIKAVS